MKKFNMIISFNQGKSFLSFVSNNHPIYNDILKIVEENSDEYSDVGIECASSFTHTKPEKMDKNDFSEYRFVNTETKEEIVYASVSFLDVITF